MFPEGWRIRSITLRETQNGSAIPAHFSGKVRNNRMRAINGNSLNQLRVIHWNLGSKLWNNKLDEIEMVLADKKPDLFFVSEANLWQDLPESERVIPGPQANFAKNHDQYGSF